MLCTFGHTVILCSWISSEVKAVRWFWYVFTNYSMFINKDKVWICRISFFARKIWQHTQSMSGIFHRRLVWLWSVIFYEANKDRVMQNMQNSSISISSLDVFGGFNYFLDIFAFRDETALKDSLVETPLSMRKNYLKKLCPVPLSLTAIQYEQVVNSILVLITILGAILICKEYCKESRPKSDWHEAKG